jgi:small subunit ribosomal protein S12
MPTLVQLSNYGRVLKKRRSKVAPFKGAPQKKAVVYKMDYTTPRKPNSARRRVAKVRVIYSNKRIFAKVPGIGVEHGLQEYSIVLVQGRGSKDTPGINYSLIRGVYDFKLVEKFGRKNRRSKFGTKSLKILN